MAARSRGSGPAPFAAGFLHPDHVPGAVPYSFSRRGSRPAKDDGLHHAGLYGIRDLEPGLGLGVVLVLRERDQHYSADHHEQDEDGSRDERDCRPAKRETSRQGSCSKMKPSSKMSSIRVPTKLAPFFFAQ